MGWFIDILFGYLIRTLIRALKARRSNTWPVENATVTFSSTSGGYGGPVAEVGYSYTHQGRFFSGGYQKPFIFLESAKRYAAGLTRGTHIVVRVKPDHPEVSLVHDSDQDETAIRLMGRFE
jgi:Protein of unknown function (DUF3592)